MRPGRATGELGLGARKGPAARVSGGRRASVGGEHRGGRAAAGQGEPRLPAPSRAWPLGASIQRGRVSVSEAQGAPPPHPRPSPRPRCGPAPRGWAGRKAEGVWGFRVGAPSGERRQWGRAQLLAAGRRALGERGAPGDGAPGERTWPAAPGRRRRCGRGGGGWRESLTGECCGGRWPWRRGTAGRQPLETGWLPSPWLGPR